MKYKETRDEEGVLLGVRLIDGNAIKCIPNTTDNKDWRAYLEWVDAGGKPEEAETPEEKVVREELEAAEAKEQMIKERQREIAIRELKEEGKLPQDYNVIRSR